MKTRNFAVALRWIITCLTLLAASPAAAQEPAPVQAMVDDVFANGRDAEIAAVVKYARRTAPDLAEALDRRLAARVAERTATEQARRANPAPLANWSGRGEIGASLAEGNTDTLGGYASLTATRQGMRWRHELRAEATYQETNGVRSQERAVLAYEPRYKVNERLSAYGLLQAEHDPVLGYDARYSVSAGLGYSLVRGPALSIDVQGGPAFRHVDPVAGPNEDGLSGRAALDARLNLRPGVKLTQTGAAFLDSDGNTFSATTALEAQLFGPLAARLSYNVQYESDPTAGRVSTDTLGRITLVYGF
jgi:putative salt-induced outer membrane protein